MLEAVEAVRPACGLCIGRAQPAGTGVKGRDSGDLEPVSSQTCHELAV